MKQYSQAIGCDLQLGGPKSKPLSRNIIKSY